MSGIPSTTDHAAGILLAALRNRIATALTIGDARRRARELAKLADKIRNIVWPRDLADRAYVLAFEVEDCVRYGGLARLAKEVN